MNRRRFLAAGLATLAASPAARRPAPGTARLGLHLWAACDALARDLDGTLRAIAAAGYAEVELYSPYLLGGRSPRELRTALDRAGLAAVSTHVTTALLYRGWERHLEAARALGCRHVVCAHLAPEERRTARDWHELAALFDGAGEIARTAGLRFGYLAGAVDLTRVQERRPYDVLVAGTDPSRVHFELDLDSVERAGVDSAVLLDRAAGRVVALHVGDARDARLARFLDRAQAAGVDHLFVERDARLLTSLPA